MAALKEKLKNMTTGRIIALGFISVILLGSLLLMLPVCRNPGVPLRYIDSLFVSTSAVCVTGLITVDIADTFSPIGRAVVAVLIQLGGLGVASVGAGIFLMMGRRISIKSRSLVRDAMNLDSGDGIIRLLKSIFLTTLIIEGAGAVAGFFIFLRDYPPLKALGLGIFHAVSAFNNSGFDLFGGFSSLTGYAGSVSLNLLTAALIILGGIGFIVMNELRGKGFRFKKLSLHSKVVLTTSFWLILAGMLVTKLTEDVSWLGAFFHSVSLRTAGFATYDLGRFSGAGLFISCFFMVVGASPGSTGGGIKTTTLFALLQGIKASATGKGEKAFRYSLPKDAFRKAAMITIMVLAVVVFGTFMLLVFEPQVEVMDALFEVCSAIGTVGLTTGITPGLGSAAKLLLAAIMFIGRIGPLTIASLWHFTLGDRVSYAEGDISIG